MLLICWCAHGDGFMQSLDYGGDEQTICLSFKNLQRRYIRSDLSWSLLVVNNCKRAAGAERFRGILAS